MRMLGTEHSANTSGGGNGIGFPILVGQWGSHVHIISLTLQCFCRKYSISLIFYFAACNLTIPIAKKVGLVHFTPRFELFRQFAVCME